MFVKAKVGFLPTMKPLAMAIGTRHIYQHMLCFKGSNDNSPYFYNKIV